MTNPRPARRGLPRPDAASPSSTTTERPAPTVALRGAASPSAAGRAAGPRPRLRTVLITVAVVVLVVLVVLAARWLLQQSGGRAFLREFPGASRLPSDAPVGFPAWLAWQHFLTVFLMVLIIRTGLTVRREKRPAMHWTSRRTGRKVSITVWLHQALDLLWILNGAVFIVLLFVSGQWMRIVPTTWEVFPNAVSAGLQYASLNWPTEDGWTNYNSLQQLSYFAIVFVVAPLAILTGVRMSTVWPTRPAALGRIYRIEWARRVHFPVMVAFVAFIVVHVGLVLATGALRNLDHMYGGQDAVNWIGFTVFVASLVVIAAAWIAARPLVLAPIARLFGTVGR